MDSKQQSMFSRMMLYKKLKIAFPIAVLGFGILIPLVYGIYLNSGPRKLIHCRYQDFTILQSKLNAGLVVVSCKLEDGKLVAFSKSAPWIPPALNSEMDVLVPK